MTVPAADGARGAGVAAALRRFRGGYGRLLEWVVGALMVLLFVEVTAGVVFRMAGRRSSIARKLGRISLD